MRVPSVAPPGAGLSEHMNVDMAFHVIGIRQSIDISNIADTHPYNTLRILLSGSQLLPSSYNAIGVEFMRRFCPQRRYCCCALRHCSRSMPVAAQGTVSYASFDARRWAQAVFESDTATNAPLDPTATAPPVPMPCSLEPHYVSFPVCHELTES
jgi:hypothetical protein